MATISAAHFQKQFGKYRDIAQRESVAITSYGRASVVLISAEEYERYRNLDDRRTEYAWEMSATEQAALAQIEPPEEAEAFNHEDPTTV